MSNTARLRGLRGHARRGPATSEWQPAHPSIMNRQAANHPEQSHPTPIAPTLAGLLAVVAAALPAWRRFDGLRRKAAKGFDSLCRARAVLGGCIALVVLMLAGARSVQSQVRLDWVQARVLTERSGHAMAYDEVRQRVVLFGGNDTIAQLSNDTWEWDGTIWTGRVSATRPGARYGHAMAFDRARQRVVLFGGRDFKGLQSDTWEWDGNNWTQRTPANNPGARSFHAMAYDEVGQRVVLFGGGGLSSDTWEWDGNNWTQRTPANNPGARSSHAMAYDATRQRVVLFGGLNSVRPFPLSDTWEWDGSNWTQRTPANNPGARFSNAMAYDAARQRVVLFGKGGLSSDTWEWDGNNWTQRTPANNPSARLGHAMAYDAARQRVVIFGGSNTNPYVVFSDTWEWDGNNWSLRGVVANPVARSGHAMVCDSARQRVVLFGGGDWNWPKDLSDTWEWNGNDWTQRTPVNSPSARSGHAMAYDSARQRVVLFGGGDSNKTLSDTWEWDGNDWTQRIPVNSPGARSGHAMAYDSARQRVVLFDGSLRSDTWEWDGTDWTQRTPLNNPSARVRHTMAYDSVRQRVVLFGGTDKNGFRSDTWEWDGKNWTQRFPMTPGARIGHAMAYDTVRQRVILFGGQDRNKAFTDTWEWDGNNWAQRTPVNNPGASIGHAMAYDSVRQCIVLFGGDGHWGVLSDTWFFGTLATSQPIGNPCPGSNGPPVLAHNDAYLGNPAFRIQLLSARPSSVCFFGFSAGMQTLPIGPCTLYLKSPMVLMMSQSNAAGFAESAPFPIPLDHALRGGTLYAQGVVVDPLVPGVGLAFSAGRKIVLGD